MHLKREYDFTAYFLLWIMVLGDMLSLVIEKQDPETCLYNPFIL